MKAIAMYLPQFHRVPENDEWYGEGFTEWTAVKDAVPLFEGHKQPRYPKDDYYYDLTDKATMVWQSDLMKRYEIDGLCIYHYWFKKGRKILEKPVENLLKWKDVDMPFCLCWANETWARTWSNIRNTNEWARKYEKYDSHGKEMLLEQTYGTENEWKEHFLYLLTFFNDPRYIRINDKPVFVIYRAELIKCLPDMMEKWQEWAFEYGLNGLYIIGGECAHMDGLDAKMFAEPQSSIRRITVKGKSVPANPRRFSFDELWDEILSYQEDIKEIYYNGLVGFDSTPRHGRDGTVIVDVSPRKFSHYLTELFAKNAANGNDITFINAWNEWGEGMYMEPDEENGYAYLEAVVYAKNHYEKYIDKYKNARPSSDEAIVNVDDLKIQNERYWYFWRILDQWLTLKEEGKRISTYLIEHEINNIAIYGFGMLGRHLLKELKGSDINVCYAIDKKDIKNQEIPIFSINVDLPNVDAIIITVGGEYANIRKQLKLKSNFKILSLEHIINEV